MTRWDPIYDSNRDLNAVDSEMSDLLIQLWSSFIKTGTPTSRYKANIWSSDGNLKKIQAMMFNIGLNFLSSGFEWTAVTETDRKYLVLDNDPMMTRTEEHQTKMDFWQQIFPC